MMDVVWPVLAPAVEPVLGWTLFSCAALYALLFRTYLLVASVVTSALAGLPVDVHLIGASAVSLATDWVVLVKVQMQTLIASVADSILFHDAARAWAHVLAGSQTLVSTLQLSSQVFFANTHLYLTESFKSLRDASAILLNDLPRTASAVAAEAQACFAEAVAEIARLAPLTSVHATHAAEYANTLLASQVIFWGESFLLLRETAATVIRQGIAATEKFVYDLPAVLDDIFSVRLPMLMHQLRQADWNQVSARVVEQAIAAVGTAKFHLRAAAVFAQEWGETVAEEMQRLASAAVMKADAAMGALQKVDAVTVLRFIQESPVLILSILVGSIVTTVVTVSLLRQYRREKAIKADWAGRRAFVRCVANTDADLKEIDDPASEAVPVKAFSGATKSFPSKLISFPATLLSKTSKESALQSDRDVGRSEQASGERDMNLPNLLARTSEETQFLLRHDEIYNEGKIPHGGKVQSGNSRTSVGEDATSESDASPMRAKGGSSCSARSSPKRLKPETRLAAPASFRMASVESGMYLVRQPGGWLEMRFDNEFPANNNVVAYAEPCAEILEELRSRVSEPQEVDSELRKSLLGFVSVAIGQWRSTRILLYDTCEKFMHDINDTSPVQHATASTATAHSSAELEELHKNLSMQTCAEVEHLPGAASSQGPEEGKHWKLIWLSRARKSGSRAFQIFEVFPNDAWYLNPDLVDFVGVVAAKASIGSVNSIPGFQRETCDSFASRLETGFWVDLKSKPAASSFASSLFGVLGGGSSSSSPNNYILATATAGGDSTTTSAGSFVSTIFGGPWGRSNSGSMSATSSGSAQWVNAGSQRRLPCCGESPSTRRRRSLGGNEFIVEQD
ncbi:unnamed protein product [Amoebophrya sp. A25]|nr:unnamed protein product [Amoebophrya sp. A25]|eukprot:GSA25T00014197001.1